MTGTLVAERPTVSQPGPATRCVNCHRPMRNLRLPAHYGHEVDIDLCPDCHLVWFDGLESVRLDGRGVLHMLRAIHAAEDGRPHEPMRAAPSCPRCQAKLQRALNRANHGPTEHHECPRGHGALQSFSLYLAEKGLVRPLHRPEYEQLRQRPEDRQRYHCLNCRAPVQPREGDACRACGAAIAVVDLQLILRAVDRQSGVLAAPGPEAAGTLRRRFDCPHCGGTVDPMRDRRCSHCAMPVTITDLATVLALIEPMAHLIEAGVVTPQRRKERLADSSRTPVVPDMGASGHKTPWWMYVGGALFMLVLGTWLVSSGRAWLRRDLVAERLDRQRQKQVQPQTATPSPPSPGAKP